MARRRGKPGAYLMSDDNTGFTIYNNQARKDYWNNYTAIPLKRNLQEIASPLNDPYPVPIFRGSQYEQTNACDFELQPQYIGKTRIPFPNTQVTNLYNLDPGIGDMAIGCTFIVRGDEYLIIGVDDFLVDENGGRIIIYQ